MRVASSSLASSEWLALLNARLAPPEVAVEIEEVTHADAGPIRGGGVDLFVASSPGQIETVRRAAPEVSTFLFCPLTFKQMLDHVLRLGRQVGMLRTAMRVIAEEERRLAETPEATRRRLAGKSPSVIFVTDTSPVRTVGFWSSEVVTLAGGEAVLMEQGAPPRVLSEAEVFDAAPDLLVTVAPADTNGARSNTTISHFTPIYRWPSDISLAYPGPQLYRAVAHLAQILQGPLLMNDA